MSRWRQDHTIAVHLFAILWATLAFIGPGYDGIKLNSAPRIALVFSILDDHSVQIDRFAPLSDDKAYFEGHTYADKAPGLSLMALPPVAALTAVAKLAGVATAPLRDGAFSNFALIAVHVATVFTSSLAAAATAAAIYLLARHLRLSQGAALLGALCYGVACPAFGWATMFVGHALAGACLFVAFALIAGTDAGRRPPLTRLLLRGGFAGFLLAWGCVVEYTTGLAAIFVGLFGLWRLSGLPPRHAAGLFAATVLGASLALVPFLVYNWLAFGGPFVIGYQYVVGFEPMKQGTMGLSLPKLAIVWELLFGQYRGLVWLSPILVALPLGWCASWRTLPRDVALILSAVPIIFLLVNAGYWDWSGGSSTGPRHMVPCLAFVGLAVAPLWDRLTSPAARWLLVVLLAASGAISVISATVTMAAANTSAESLLRYLFAHFAAGNIHNVADFLLRLGPLSQTEGPVHLLTLLFLPLWWTLVVAEALHCIPWRSGGGLLPAP